MKSWKNAFIALSIFAWCGCAHLATVKTTQPLVPTIAATEDELTLAKQHLVAAERAQPLVALGDDLSAAKISRNLLQQQPTDRAALTVYNFSVARAVENVERAKIQPWQRKIDIVGDHTTYTLTTPKPVDPDPKDPRNSPPRQGAIPSNCKPKQGRP